MPKRLVGANPPALVLVPITSPISIWSMPRRCAIRIATGVITSPARGAPIAETARVITNIAIGTPTSLASMPILFEAVATVQAIASVQMKTRIDSQIMKVNVEEGALVKEGDLLFELDSRTLRAQLGQIEAQIRMLKACELFIIARVLNVPMERFYPDEYGSPTSRNGTPRSNGK